MSEKNKNIGIIGLGLIGGSLALKLIEQEYKVYGFVRDLARFKSSQKVSSQTEKSFAKLTENFEDLKDCDIVFVCTPLRLISGTLREIQPFLKPNSITTDVGSVKSLICEESKKFFRSDCFFVGGHPMAGTEKAGFNNSFPELFESKKWVLIEDKSLAPELISPLKKIINSTGAIIVETDAHKHDQAVAYISHLPLLLSIGLLETVNSIETQELKDLALDLASSGFESMTRLAKGNQVLNEDLLSLNLEQINTCFRDFSELSKKLLDK